MLNIFARLRVKDIKEIEINCVRTCLRAAIHFSYEIYGLAVTAFAAWRVDISHTGRSNSPKFSQL